MIQSFVNRYVELSELYNSLLLNNNEGVDLETLSVEIDEIWDKLTDEEKLEIDSKLQVLK